MIQTVEKTIAYRIKGTGVGWAFSPRDFLDLGGRPTVDSALHRLEKRGEIRRVIRGVYDYPRFSKLLDQHLSPDIDQVARALARKFRWRIQPGGATALNFIGLSTQVPARAVYLSDGPDRAYQVGNSALVFEHTASKESGVKLKESGLIVQALKSLGQSGLPQRSSRRFGMVAGIAARQGAGRHENGDRLGLQRNSADRRRGPTWIRSPREPQQTGGIYLASRQVDRHEFRHCRKGFLGLLDSQTPLCGTGAQGEMVFKGGTSLSKVFGLIDQFFPGYRSDPRFATARVWPCGGQRSLPNHPVEDKAEPLQPGEESQGCGIHSRYAACSTESALCAGSRHCRQHR